MPFAKPMKSDTLEARENASDNRGPLAPRGLDSMDNQRGDDPGDVGGSDDGEVDAPVQHDRHHTQSEEADLGQLEGHRSKISRGEKSVRVQDGHQNHDRQEHTDQRKKLAILLEELGHRKIFRKF